MAYTTTTQELFATFVPGFLAGAAPSPAGRVLFDIEGMNGGTWLVDFGARTVTGGARAADAVGATGVAQGRVQAIVRAAERDFMALVEGRMSADDGLLTQRLRVAGDAASIAHLMDAFAGLRATLPR
jgi:hypothetical protein